MVFITDPEVASQPEVFIASIHYIVLNNKLLLELTCGFIPNHGMARLGHV